MLTLNVGESLPKVYKPEEACFKSGFYDPRENAVGEAARTAIDQN